MTYFHDITDYSQIHFCDKDKIETDSIKSEINEIKEILAGLPEGHPIERMGFEARLKTVSETLKDKEAT